MEAMICIRGEAEQIPFLREISGLNAGIELGSYGIVGIQSEQLWAARFADHRKVRAQFTGKVALHGPFIGMEYAHEDCLIREVVQKRLDMTFEVAKELEVSRVVLHSGFTSDTYLLGLHEGWLKRNTAFWKTEVERWARAKIGIVLENVTDKTPDLLLRILQEVEDPYLGLCMDTGHLHLFSDISQASWIASTAKYLRHVHIHDNDGKGDRHWPIGKGTIDFRSFYKDIAQYAPEATVSVEVDGKIDSIMDDLRKVVEMISLT